VKDPLYRSSHEVVRQLQVGKCDVVPQRFCEYTKLNPSSVSMLAVMVPQSGIWRFADVSHSLRVRGLKFATFAVVNCFVLLFTEHLGITTRPVLQSHGTC